MPARPRERSRVVPRAIVAAIAAASRPAAPGATTTMARVGLVGGRQARRPGPARRRPASDAVPVFASADTPRRSSADADAVVGGAAQALRAARCASAPAARIGPVVARRPATRAITSSSARGVVRGPSRPTIAAAPSARSRRSAAGPRATRVCIERCARQPRRQRHEEVVAGIARALRPATTAASDRDASRRTSGRRP